MRLFGLYGTNYYFSSIEFSFIYVYESFLGVFGCSDFPVFLMKKL